MCGQKVTRYTQVSLVLVQQTQFVVRLKDGRSELEEMILKKRKENVGFENAKLVR